METDRMNFSSYFKIRVNKRHLYILLSCGLLTTLMAQSQKKDSDKKTEIQPDSQYVAKYPDVFTVGIFTASPVMQLTIKPVDKNLEKYKSDFRGNFSDLVGFSLSYKKLSISLGFKSPLQNPNNESKGKTSSTGIAVQFRKTKFNISAEYRQYTGYYDNNSPNYAPITDSVIIRPDLRFKNIGLNGIYNFSWRKYSYNAPLTYNDRQLKTRVGLLVKGGINYTTISSADTTLLYSVQTNEFTSFDKVTAINALLFKLGPGVGITLVLIKRFYLAVNGFAMGNFINYTYNVQGYNDRDWSTNMNFYTETNIGFGYNSKRLFAGLSINGDINLMRVRDAGIRTYFATTLITIGYRFEPPKFMKKGYKKVPLLNRKEG